MTPDLATLLGGIVIIILMVTGFVIMSYGRLWIQARSSGVHVSFFSLVGMSLRKVSPSLIVNAMIMSQKAGLSPRQDFLESHTLARGNVPVLTQALIMLQQSGLAVDDQALGAHLLAGGDVSAVAHALIAADKAGISLSFENACAIDLAGRDIVEAVHTSVNPRVIDCPKPEGGKSTLDAVARDGIQVKARARVTVRTCMERLVGGATDETIIARVGEGLVSAIGSSNSYMEVLENPELISNAVLDKGLDSGTAFEILSIDIADVDVGENVGAKLDIDRAEAKKQVSQANAEKRAAEARATQAEQEARISEMRAEVVRAEADVPRAMAAAFRSGNMGLLTNPHPEESEADQSRRESIDRMREDQDPPA
ncbi:MAG: flotillin-like FloA family protein [Planctomycetota bacterium]|jgi:uncharacterized protein YqfA (UPF0365 family)